MKKVLVTSNFNVSGREYETNSTNILEIAEKYGRCEGGERIQLFEGGELIAMAMYTSEEGGFYYQVEI